jgi:hypothetical protein
VFAGMKAEVAIVYLGDVQCQTSIIDLAGRKKYVRVVVGPAKFSGAFFGENTRKHLGKCHYQLSERKDIAELTLINDEKLRTLIGRFGRMNLVFN